jgi:hypothetical protein
MLSDVESPRGSVEKIDTKVSENTVDFAELAKIGKEVGKYDKFKGVGKAGEILEMYTFFSSGGPKQELRCSIPCTHRRYPIWCRPSVRMGG